MTEHEIQTKLLAYYKEKLAGLPEEDWAKYCWLNNIHNGLCYCAREVFGQNINYDAWVISATGGKMYLCEKPARCFSRPAVISALQTRIDILTSLTLGNTAE